MAEQLARIRLLSQSATAWTATNPVLLRGEVGFQDVEGASPRMRVGDGLRAWNSLPDMSLQGPVGPTGATGPAGTAGATGSTGPPPNLAIGTVTTLAPGSAATVTITGSSPNYVINYGIPRGNTGAQGPTGPSGTSTFSGCRVRATSIPIIAHNSSAFISWDNDVHDFGAWHVTPSTDLVVPSGVGWIDATAQVVLTGLQPSGNFVTVWILVNGFAYAMADIRTHALDRVGANDPYTITLHTGPVPVSAGQVIKLQVSYQNFTFGSSWLTIAPAQTFLSAWAIQKS